MRLRDTSNMETRTLVAAVGYHRQSRNAGSTRSLWTQRVSKDQRFNISQLASECVERRSVRARQRCPHLVDMRDELLGAAEIQRAQRTHEAAAVIRPFLALLRKTQRGLRHIATCCYPI